jgi:hypothetical protein
MNKYLILIATFLIISCAKKNDKQESILTLDVDTLTCKPYLASDIFSLDKITILETTPKSVMARVQQIELYNNNYYIGDVIRQQIYIFNLKGQLIKRFNRQGKGYGEYLTITDFIVDPINKSLEILDMNTRKIFIYDIETFKFLNSYNIPFLFAHFFAKKGNYYYFQTFRNENKINNKSTRSDVIAFNYKTGEVTALFNPPIEKDNRWYEFSPIFNIDSEHNVNFSFIWDKFIYQSVDNKAKKICEIKAPKSGINEHIIHASYNEKLDYMKSDDFKNKRCFFRLIFKNKNYMIFSFNNQNKANHIIVNDKKIVGVDIINDFNQIKGVEFYLIKQLNDKLLAIILPEKIDQNSSVAKKLNISEYSNPIFLILKPKENEI